MPKKEKLPSTQALRFLRSNEVKFKPYFYKYIDHGGTLESSKQLNVEEHRIVKTLIFEDNSSKPFVVLMNGDYEVSSKKLARVLGVKNVKIAPSEKAEKYSGYKVGGTSPFGLKTKMNIFAQKDIFEFDTILINGGQRGFLVEISTEDLKKVLNLIVVDVAITKK
ncbi:YbaK/EbsC family protein [Hippea maritima]|uniref:Cys-tRNA(Pro)/Cys-tRNA(Cys) deacylase n=1 Tax=Hippea maritima (strain ATCC 700847 / DSM 10411 / MH2) TaxID=760142 RepID=F2LY33_HIPMA|nr:YbaK/EbsC family protein [Hippea maritima]AEA34356.1 YbaK/prolyl-tRNA synthetase associated region [Hippea maritima DSM 10411]